MGKTRSLSILVLDDHVEVAESLRDILELERHRVTLVHDGLSAVKAFREHNFDLGFFDIKMPGLNGVESFLEIKKNKPWAKIIMMSGFADDQLISKALDNGALGLLRKPFEVEELLAKLADAAGLCSREAVATASR
ncbi:MAG TPA: response regulator [Hyphomicrobiaceae bacterium]|nr:response regulator [Hyphomicrobiaceae bacterium]